MRYRLVHGYATVNADRVAETVRVHLAPLITALEAALSNPLPDEQ